MTTQSTEKVSCEYKSVKVIGSGRYAEVYLAHHGGKNVALKKLFRRANPKYLKREQECLKAVSSPHIITLLDTFREDSSTILVFPYLPITLFHILEKFGSLSPRAVESIAPGIFKGLFALHGQGYIHRDIKPSNIMISEDGIVQLIDFGQATTIGNKADNLPLTAGSHGIGTRWYKPIEFLYGAREYGPEVDMWSTGCILGELVNGSPLFDANSDIFMLCTIQKFLGTPRADEWPELTSLPDYGKICFDDSKGEGLNLQCKGVLETTIRACLQLTPSRRITAEDASKINFNDSYNLAELVHSALNGTLSEKKSKNIGNHLKAKPLDIRLPVLRFE